MWNSLTAGLAGWKKPRKTIDRLFKEAYVLVCIELPPFLHGNYDRKELTVFFLQCIATTNVCFYLTTLSETWRTVTLNTDKRSDTQEHRSVGKQVSLKWKKKAGTASFPDKRVEAVYQDVYRCFELLYSLIAF